MDRNPETIRSQLQSLKTLQLVKGGTGADDGYWPTETGYAKVATVKQGNGDTETTVYSSSVNNKRDAEAGEHDAQPTPGFCTKCGAELNDRVVLNYCPEYGYEF